MTSSALCDEVWVAHVPPPVARARLMARNNLSGAEADKRIASQMANAERLARTTDGGAVANGGTPAELEAAVARAFAALVRRRRPTTAAKL